MIDLSTLMQGLTRDADHHAITVTEDWLQGRTVYGGLAAVICVESTLREIFRICRHYGPRSSPLSVRPQAV